MRKVVELVMGATEFQAREEMFKTTTSSCKRDKRWIEFTNQNVRQVRCYAAIAARGQNSVYGLEIEAQSTSHMN